MKQAGGSSLVGADNLQGLLWYHQALPEGDTGRTARLRTQLLGLVWQVAQQQEIEHYSQTDLGLNP